MLIPCMQPEASIPSETMMHFPPVSDFPPIFDKFSDFEKIFYNFTFSRKISSFSSAKISDDLFYQPQISNFSPIFAVSVHFHPVFRKLFFPPYFDKFPLCFRQIHLPFTYSTCISFPPTLTLMHLCITQCTYWTPLHAASTNTDNVLADPALFFSSAFE